MKTQFTPSTVLAVAAMVSAPLSNLATAEEPRIAMTLEVVPPAGKELAPDGKVPVELGKVRWSRDFEKAAVESRETGKPMMVLFNEVPGCGGCQTYGKILLSDPVLVEAAETLFIPVFIRNNDPDKDSADSKLLNRFEEKRWNYPVIRFMNAAGEDIAPATRNPDVRKDAWATLLTHMTKALEAAGRPVPKYLEVFVAEYGARETATVRFAMGCYWSSEAKLGALPGVVRTRIGYHKLAPSANEIVEVVYDPERTDFETLLKTARAQKCAQWVILPENDPTLETVRKIFGADGVKISSEPCTFKDKDINHQSVESGSTLARR